MFHNHKGFSLVETFASLSLLLLLITTSLPLLIHVKQQEVVLSDRRHIQSSLHDELISMLHLSNSTIPTEYERTIQDRTVTFTFSIEKKNIKGCVQWQNANEQTENFCLYGK
ncbi:hypothetical protein KO561_11095 [Radiobacillus kanasensis]|uniref:hypothetical protein n=1 Tax=Radiobacillus kanasensis TaxID=2844358 RepID=UPI001E3AF8D2|nr:hypothetical protein [Radiobacillus kanasensis]UFT97769.1 hypothetical protein KO561_11095 [Radiobacillus kanasensis]